MNNYTFSLLALLFAFFLQVQCSTFNAFWNLTMQRIDGFGASSAWQPSISEATADMFFSESNGIGLSLLRTRIAPVVANATTEITIAQQAIKRGATVWSTPWSPPAPWKTNNNVDYDGQLIPKYYSTYANWLADYVDNCAKQGVPIYAISVNNEPNMNVSYESCYWNSQMMHDFTAVLGPVFKSRGISAKIMMAEESGWTWEDVQDTMNDANTNIYISILAAHLYGSSPSPVPYQKTVWETEVSDLSGKPDPSINSGLTWAQVVHQTMVNGRANAFHWWWLSASDASGLTLNFAPTKRLYCLGQFSKFVRPGWERFDIQPDQSGDVFVSGYKSSTGNFAIVVINTGGATTFTVNLEDFGTVSAITPYITDASRDLVAQSTITAKNSFQYDLPAQSVVTFVGSANGPNVPPPTYSSANLFKSGADFENGANGVWQGFGCTLTPTSVTSHGGQYSGYVTQRTQQWNGASFNILSLNQPAGSYLYISAWVQRDSGTTASYLFTLTLSSTIDGTNTYTTLNSIQDTNAQPTWIRLIGGYRIPYANVTNLFAYVSGPAVGLNFYVDNASVTLTPLDVGSE